MRFLVALGHDVDIVVTAKSGGRPNCVLRETTRMIAAR